MATEKRLVYAEEVEELIAGMDSLPWEEEVETLVNSLTTVDAVEVVHGLWVTDEKGVTYCGRCKVIDDFASVHNYCPNCGAKMDGERKDNE